MTLLGIVHGDLGPENILIFADSESENGVTPKITDFGCSGFTTDDNPFVFLTTKEPWRAPEIHRREFSFDAAVKTDIFSLGLMCFWMVFYEELTKNDVGGDMMDIDRQPTSSSRHEAMSLKHTQTLERLLKLKETGQILQIAISFVESVPGIQSHIVTMMRHLFNQTLDADPAKRFSCVDDLFSLVGVAR
jgi:serine/threonine protein kinase